MTSTTISNVRETSIETMRDDAIVVTNTGAIKSATTSIYGGSGAFTILGSVTSDQGGIDVKGGHIGSYSRNSSVSVGASGSIVGGTFGARIGSNYDIIVSDVFNAGLIVGQKAEGLFLGGNVVNLINEGTIQSYLGTALIVEARGAVINNTGTIIGGGDLFENKAIQFLNEGSIIVNNSGDIYGDISGGAYDDTYDGRFGFIQGKIDLGLGNNTAIGGEGSEIFIVSGGSNAVDGGGGNDSVAFEGATTGVHVDLRITESQDTHFGMLSLRQVETVNGSSHNDTLIGNENSNALFGGNGNDTLEDTSGNDTLDGGGDIDTALFSGSAGAHVDLAISNRQNTGYGSDVIIGIENLKGGSGSDWFKGDANANLLSGNGGNDTLAGGLGDDTLDGGAGINTAVFAGQAADSQITNNGDGSFTVTGPDGSDLVKTVRLLEFTDKTMALWNSAPTSLGLSASSVSEAALAGTLIASLSARDADGDSLSYSLAAGSPFRIDGTSLVLAGPLDFETKASHSLMVVARDAYGGEVSQSFTLQVTDAVEFTPFTLTGTAGADRLEGETGNDVLTGLSGADVLLGEVGNDVLAGGAGKDVLTGGAGQDVFVFDSRPNKTTNVDRIEDFKVADDTLHLARSVFTKMAKKGVIKSAEFYQGPKAHDRDDRLIYDKKTGALYYDADGTGAQAQIQIATLSKNLKMTYRDFFVV